LPNYFSSDGERTERLKNFKEPICIIQGRQDPIGESTLFEIRDLMPQSEVYFIEKCGHMPWLENPQQAQIFFAMLNKCLK
jgi:proline iminopeptidase